MVVRCFCAIVDTSPRWPWVLVRVTAKLNKKIDLGFLEASDAVALVLLLVATIEAMETPLQPNLR